MIEANEIRLKSTIENIAKFSEPIEYGVQRLSYTDEYKAAQKYLVERMREMDMRVFVDSIGNLFGILEGSENKKFIMSGSHLDTVRNAGKFDGIAGIASALEVVEMLRLNGKKLKHPYLMACFVEEEGTRFNQTTMGSQFFCGVHNSDELYKFADSGGNTLVEVLKTYNLNDIAPIERIVNSDVVCMIELHGEQGPVLEQKNTTIGIVDRIVGIVWLEITIKGFANHGGTVPMNMRKDAGIESYRAILEIDRYVSEKYSSTATVTIGKLQLEPNSPNCIPGKCTFLVDIRSGEEEIMHDNIRQLESILKQVNNKGYEYKVEIVNEKKPVYLNEKLKDIIRFNCEKHGYTYTLINSGAGHDSMVFASFIPTSMIFVPNIKGISHNPEENISYDDLRIGTNVLYETICTIDDMEE